MTDETQMKDDAMDGLIRQAAQDYREPPAADFDAIWARVESAHFGATAPRMVPRTAARSAHRWLRPVMGIAATLVIGVGIGRMTAPPKQQADPERSASVTGETVRPASDLSEPLQRVTYAYVARTTLLLDSLAASKNLRGDARLAADASQLLSTTRLLLDSPAATDPRMRALLEDLELVLAQVASLRTAPRAEDLTFIADAMTERDVVPRLRTVAASYSGY